jgi:hypothetical protein
MVWRCHDDFTGEVIQGEPHRVEVCVDRTVVRRYDVAAANPDDLVDRLGQHLAGVADQLAAFRVDPPDPPPAETEEPPLTAPSPLKVNGAVLPPDPDALDQWRVAPELDREDPEDDGVTFTRTVHDDGTVTDSVAGQPADLSDLIQVRVPASAGDMRLDSQPPAPVDPDEEGDRRLAAEAMLLDSDEAWTPKRVAEETGLSLAEAREVLAKVRRETRSR